MKAIVNLYSLKRFTNEEIIKKIFEETKEKVTSVYISQVRQTIKKEAAKWYQSVRENEFEYIYQFKERIEEIIWLQKKHYDIIVDAEGEGDYETVQTSLAELHRLNVTLSNYYDVAPAIMVDHNNKNDDSKKMKKL